ncbi:biofilm regulation diguanylate cyclase SiaD [Pokkaliibacter sp. MBI-7]|uniref:biofilm regulation diguanylate cyclase SiaD n=1 Tax=Pokkaliibacter sp. MBI-7 TaxID=3040600 RepID=UPI0024485205|nr:biofilm regulation diguanylate cyclase SiaD [Pokkaliibacter sp. MBI-7]MDH2433359.1 biofilm regulation diguanylate cyclase SiaD [Pokkaliibacter sp. MBI-7]
MKVDPGALEKRIQMLLDDKQYQGHPLREALAQLWSMNQEQWARVERITQLSDSYQAMMMRREHSLSARFDKQLRQLEKITRISDRYQRMLRDMNLALEEASFLDPLTDLPNRRMLMRRLEDEVENSNKSQHGFAVAMLDVDYFKQVNDSYGHQVGDEVLMRLGQMMQQQVDELGVCGRWGGEEFLLLVAGQDESRCLQLFGQLQRHISGASIDIAGISLSVTVSLGVSVFRPGEPLDAVLNRADNALYEAKQTGRNRMLRA